METSKESRSNGFEQQEDLAKTSRWINIAFILTLIVGMLISGFTISCILDLIFELTPNASVSIFPFIFVLLNFLAPLGSIIVIINYIMLKKVRELKISGVKYIIAYISVFINSIPALIVIGAIFCYMFKN